MVGAKFFLIPLIGLVITVSSCNESSVVGLDVQPAGDLLNVGWQDTTTLVSKTVREDSLHTDASVIITADALIGAYNDPIFGRATASLYTQLRLPTNAPTFGSIPICDSVIMSLVYDPTAYGKLDRKVQTMNVYQLAEDVSTSSDYYSNNTLSKAINDLANARQFIPHPLDSVTVIGSRQKPQLRIPLQTNFGQVILNNQNLPALSSNETFQSLTKGLYITTENTPGGAAGDGNILHFKMADALTKITIYYHNSNATDNDSLHYDIQLGAVARFSSFAHDYSSANPYLVAQLSSTPPAVDTTLFVQSMAGVKVKIELPYLKNWNDHGRIAINKAELVIKVDSTSALYQLDTFAAPTGLVLFGITAGTNVNYVIPDAYDANEVYGGSYNAATRTYTFNIERYVQQILNGYRENTGMYLVASGGAVNANRVVLGAAASTGYQKMKLNITYTKLH
ncbi:MAG: hypothetical protein JWP12_2183 [Bacteroidetes bacterium]|nr:hypothetical protein [Bacteroidota bacterium]